MEEDREMPWNFHTCKSCPYRSKSTFVMCKHVRRHRTRSKTDSFICESDTPEVHECEFCEFETNVKVDLTEHFRVFHEEKAANEEMEDILRCLRCEICNFETHSVLVLANHDTDCKVEPGTKHGNNLSLTQKDERNAIQSKETRERVKLATIELHDTIVNINFEKTVHKGIYSGVLFHATSTANDDKLHSYLFQRDPPDRNHECSINYRDTKFVATLSRDEVSNRYEFESQYCLDAKVFLSGNEVTFMNGTKNIACLEMVNKKSSKKITVSYDPSARSKRHCCLYCGKLNSAISRHLISNHKNEKDIKHILSLTPNSKRRNELLRKLRLEGDKNFNDEVDNTNKITVRRPVARLLTDYQHCPACKALLCKKNFARHYIKCTGRRLDRQRIVEQENESTASQDYHARLLEKLLGSLKSDTIGQIVRSDRALNLLALYYALLYSRSSHQMQNSRGQLRRCGRLLTVVKEMDPDVSDFADCLKVTRYETIMNAIRHLCNLKDGDDSASTEKPFLALQFGPIISQIVERLKVDLLKRGKGDVDPEYVELVKFKQIHDRDFRIEITRRALITANINKLRNKPDLPTGN